MRTKSTAFLAISTVCILLNSVESWSTLTNRRDALKAWVGAIPTAQIVLSQPSSAAAEVQEASMVYQVIPDASASLNPSLSPVKVRLYLLP